MRIKVVLVDVNPKLIAAWRHSFEENSEVEILHGSMLDQQVSAWVSPTNAAGRMDGGLDLVLKNYLGNQIEHKLQAAIKSTFNGAMPVGHATCLPTGRPLPRFLISTPTMVGSSDDISDTLNVALACAAAFQAVHMQNAREPSIRSVALPGLGAATGRVPVEICADLMWTAYDLFRERQFSNFGEMRKALEAILGELDSSASAKAKVAAGQVAGAQGFGAPAADYDFDDAEDDDEDDEDEDRDFDDTEDD